MLLWLQRLIWDVYFYWRWDEDQHTHTNTHTWSHTYRHKHCIVCGLSSAAQTYRNTLIYTFTHTYTHTQAPQACGYHKGPCHMLSRYIPTQWCQFVHLNLRLLIYSSETQQLKATVNTVQSLMVDKLRFLCLKQQKPICSLGPLLTWELCDTELMPNSTGYFQNFIICFV